MQNYRTIALTALELALIGGPTPTRTENCAFGVRCFTIETMGPFGEYT